MDLLTPRVSDMGVFRLCDEATALDFVKEQGEFPKYEMPTNTRL